MLGKKTLIFAIFTLIFLGCAPKDKGNYLVKVDRFTLKPETFKRRFTLSKNYKDAEKIEETDITEFINNYFLESLLLTAESYNQNLDQDKEFQNKMENIRKNILVNTNGLLFEKLMPKEFQVTDQEVRQLYNRINSKIKMANILVTSKHQANIISSKLDKGESFGELAKKYSIDVKSSRNDGVRDSYITRGNFSDHFEEIVFSLEAGEVSKSIKDHFGYHIVKVIEKEDVTKKPFNEKKAELGQKIRSKKYINFLINLNSNLRKKYNLQINDELVPLLIDNFNNERRPGKIKKEQIPEEKLSKTIIEYKNGSWTLEKLIDHFNKSLSPVIFLCEEDVEFYINKVVQEDLKYQEALSMNLQNTKKFDRFYRKMEEKKLKEYGREKLLYSKISVSDQEIEKYYQNHQDEYSGRELSEVKASIKNDIHSKKMINKRKNILNKLSKKFNIDYNKAAIRQVADELNTKKQGEK